MLLNGHDKYAKSYWKLMLFSGCNFEGKFLTALVWREVFSGQA